MPRHCLKVTTDDVPGSSYPVNTIINNNDDKSFNPKPLNNFENPVIVIISNIFQ